MVKGYEIVLEITLKVTKKICASNEEEAELLAQEIIENERFDVSDYDEITNVEIDSIDEEGEVFDYEG